MGNTETKNPSNRQVQVLHQKFKMVQVTENMQQMILTIPYQQKSDIIEWQKLLKSVRDCDPEFLLMPKKYMITQQGLCGSSGVIKIVYDCFTYSFQEQIRNHSEKFKCFEQAEIWYLLFAIISSVREMDRLGMKVGDIRPHNIFVNENGQVKLSGVYSWPREVENTLKTSYDKVVTYLSPQQLHQCRVGDKQKRSSYIIGESFSVGLTLLHTCLLKQLDQLYNIRKFQFNLQKLQYQISQLRKLTYWNEQKGRNEKYSQQLVHVITGLLEIDESKRLSTIDLFNQLQPHAEEILNLRQFQIPRFNNNNDNTLGTPVKQQQQQRLQSQSQQPQHQSILMFSSLDQHQNRSVSPQYSSIQKKQFYQPQSIAFSTGNYQQKQQQQQQSFLITNNNNNQPSISNIPLERSNSPQKQRTKSKQKMVVSLINNQRVSYLNKTQQIPQYPRQSVSRQKFNSNPQHKLQHLQQQQQQHVNFSMPNTQMKTNKVNVNSQFVQQPQQPSSYQYTAQFKTYDTQFPQSSFKPVIGSNYPQQQLNYTTSSYVTSNQPQPQQSYNIPTQQPIEYRPITNPQQSFNLNYLQSQSQTTPQFAYKPITTNVQQTNAIGSGNYQYQPITSTTMTTTTGGGYPFTKNIQFTKSDYTLVDQSNIITSQRPSITAANQQLPPGYSNNIYQTSTVKAVMPGQTSFTNAFGTGSENKISNEPSQLLKKIDQQLNKSKLMYTNNGGTNF